MLRDRDIREPLFDFLEETYGKVRIIEEKTMGKSRADIVMVAPDALYGIEIKSDADTYARLARQVKDYDNYYDFNIVVAGTRHAMHICEHVPQYWGIITVEQADDEMDFYVLRKPERNTGMKLERKLSILWRPELAKLQEWNNMPKYKEKSKAFVIEKIVQRVPGKISEEVIRQQISDILFERDYNDVTEMLSEYRKGEIQKKLDKETDSEKQLELMMMQAEKRSQLLKKGTQKKSRRKVF
ncbi:MAG: sce7726 family protein [Clostridiales bacterium]|nr:sce7726 family protein [Clostridiales bacterium]MDY3747866.1 sce7726 family protein [Lachnospiraceae bacterium]